MTGQHGKHMPYTTSEHQATKNEKDWKQGFIHLSIYGTASVGDDSNDLWESETYLGEENWRNKMH